MFFLLVADLPLFHPAASCPRSAAHRPIDTTKYMYKLLLSLIQILDWVKISKTRRILQKEKKFLPERKRAFTVYSFSFQYIPLNIRFCGQHHINHYILFFFVTCKFMIE